MLVEVGVVKHGMDLGGLLGVSCADLQFHPGGLGLSSCPGCEGVRLYIHDGLCWMKDRAPSAVASMGQGLLADIS